MVTLTILLKLTRHIGCRTGTVRGLAVAVTISSACSLLSACAVAPGMRMPVSSLPAGAGASPLATNSDAPASTVADATQSTPTVPVTELDLALLKEMQGQRQSVAMEQAKALAVAPQPYTIGSGDVLQIVVWDHPEIAAAMGSSQIQQSVRPGDPTSGFVVGQDGNLTFPFAGTEHVSGLRIEQIQKHLSTQLARFFVNPQVTVRVASYRAQEIYVEGEVHNPGVFAVNDIPMSLYEAIARAGGFSDAADQSDLQLVRGGVSQRLNLTQILANGLSPSRLYMQPGDHLRVVARDENDVYVMGEVMKPSSAIPRRTGRITLADALSQAGGVNPSTSDAAEMFVIRGTLNGTPKVFHLDGRSPVAMLVAKEFDLEPKDVVYVDGNGLVRFSRVLSLLLPAMSVGLTAGVVAK